MFDDGYDTEREYEKVKKDFPNISYREFFALDGLAREYVRWIKIMTPDKRRKLRTTKK